MTYYAGIDVSLRTVNICVVDDDGELVAETKLSSDVQEIVAYLDELEYSIDHRWSGSWHPRSVFDLRPTVCWLRRCLHGSTAGESSALCDAQ